MSLAWLRLRARLSVRFKSLLLRILEFECCYYLRRSIGSDSIEPTWASIQSSELEII